MKTVFIDTHFNDILIVLYNDGLVVDKCEVINKKNNSEYIFPSLVKVIDKVKLDNIIVVTGPGSFTGVRLGVTIAKTLAYTLNIPIRTITSLECMAISSNNKKVAFLMWDLGLIELINSTENKKSTSADFIPKNC